MEPSNYLERSPPAGVLTWPKSRLVAYLDDASALAQAIVDTIRDPLLILDQGLRVVTANHAFHLWTSMLPLYPMKPSFLNLFMKELTRDRVVPIISASVSWLTFAIPGSGVPSLPKFANSSSRRARRFSLELNS